jgi:excisionase family DNA binding protein
MDGRGECAVHWGVDAPGDPQRQGARESGKEEGGGRVRQLQKLLTEEQVCELTGLSPTTLRDMRAKVKKDPLPFYKLGRCVRYGEQDLAKWLERHRFLDDKEAGFSKGA